MRATPIARPLPNEHVFAAWPLPGADARDHWNRRLNLFTGRSLDADALTLEQASRAGRLATYSQARTSGVVQGLDVALEREGDTRARWFYRIGAGFGLAASGEDVFVPRELRVNVLDVQVCAPPHQFELDLNADEVSATSTQLLARAVGPALGRLIENREAVENPGALPDLPRVGILLLQPTVLERVGEYDPNDTCERDPANDAFEDWQTVDATRLLWYAWPTEWHSLPRLDRRRRNQIAYDIFQAEAALGRDDLLPWESFGVPLGLVAFNRRWKPLFFDRHAVVRQGGEMRERTTVIPGASKSVARARFKQFVEQVADAPSDDPRELVRELRWLPPVGILPRSVLQPREGQDYFFPSSWRVEATPVPLEELDAALQPSAGLAPLDLFAGDEVEVLVPVPHAWYEPELLIREVVDPLFLATIDRFVIRRGRWLQRRAFLRSRLDRLDKAIGNPIVEYPEPDPLATDAEEYVATTGIDVNDPELRDAEKEYGTADTTADTPPRGIVSLEIETLRTHLRAGTPLRGDISRAYLPITKMFTANMDRLPTTLRARISKESNVPYVRFTGEMTNDDKKLLDNAAGGDSEWLAALATLHQRSRQNEIIELDRQGLKRYIEWLQRRVDEADDRVDFAFARVHTDIYRIRQTILGNEAATRLATSPALAMIAKGESARATQADVQTFVRNLKSQAAGTVNLPAAPAAPGGEGTGAGTATLFRLPLSLNLATMMGSQLRFTSGASPAADGGGAAPVGSLTTPIMPKMAFSGGVGAVLAGASINAGLTGGITAAALRATAESARVLPPVPNRLVNEAITEQAPLVGKALNFRTVSIAERLQQPVAPEAKDFGVSNKADVLRMLTELPINIDDIELPGFYRYSGTTLDKTPYTVGGRTLERPIERRFNVLDVAGRDLIAEVLQEKHDLDPTDGDEGAFFAAAVRSLDNVVAILRLIEGRILAYRLVIDTCREALGRINEQRAAVQARMFVIATGLAEARQDVAVARALLDEERRRVGAVNYRRDDIVRNHVPYFAFRRPRSVDLSIEAPGRRLDPGITDAPLPACMAEAVDIPPGLGQMVSHMRDAPASWFRHVHPLIDKLNQPHVLLQSLQYAKVRAIVHHEAILALRASGPDVAGEHDSIRRVLSARQDVASRSRALTAQLDVGELTALSWANVRERARETLSVGDLADGAHGRAEVARGAAEELDRIAHVGACLYNRFGEVRPAIRLGWAEQLGQYDEAVSLQNLSALPQWGDIDLLDRREMQGLTDWLFSRIDAGNADAHALMSDLIRLCILIASHAPVDRILAAKIEQPTTVQPGARLHLAVDTVTARIGMHVVVYGPSGAGASSNVVARGVVEDLGGGRAAARIVETIGAAVNLATSSVVHLVSPASTLAALTPKPAATPPQPGAGAQSFGNLFGIHW